MESNTGIIINVKLFDEKGYYGLHTKDWEWLKGQQFSEDNEAGFCFLNISDDLRFVYLEMLAKSEEKFDAWWNLAQMWNKFQLLRVKLGPNPSYLEYDIRIDDVCGEYLTSKGGKHQLNLSNIYIDFQHCMSRRWYIFSREYDQYEALAEAWDQCQLTATPESITDYKMV